MKKGGKKRPKTFKKGIKGKPVRKRARAVRGTSTSSHVRQARNYPFAGCWIQPGWDEAGLAVVVIARRQPDGNIAFGNYLVDYYCLGLKNTFCNANIPAEEFRRHYLARLISQGRPLSISPALAHEIIYGGIEYAAQFGFQPHHDFKLSQHILDPPDTHPTTGEVEFGKDGKPLYVSGPYDDVDAIMRQLTRTAGKDNFDFLMQVAGPLPDEWDDDDFG